MSGNRQNATESDKSNGGKDGAGDPDGVLSERRCYASYAAPASRDVDLSSKPYWIQAVRDEDDLPAVHCQ
jgi:hypothetical protein